jgi:O-acetyl-ADP-ribose deacetylase (regulator of RNase III)
MNKKMTILQGDITEIEVDGIVNAANKSLLGGGGVDGAIHRAAGPELLEATKKLGGADTGEAKITEGYNLPADYVIHTVGPVYKDGKQNEPELLKACYENALRLADEHGLETLAFSSISTGVYGYPIKDATRIAVTTIKELLPTTHALKEVIFVVFSEKDKNVYEEVFEQLDIKNSF